MRVSIYLIQLFLFGLTFTQHDEYHSPRKTNSRIPKPMVPICDDCNAILVDKVECKGNNNSKSLNNCLTQFQNASSFIINGFRSFSEKIFDIKMEKVVNLDLSNNSIDILNIIHFQNLPNLRNLTLEYNQLSNLDLKSLFNISKNLKMLKINSELDNVKLLELNEDLIIALVLYKNTFNEFQLDFSDVHHISCIDCNIEILINESVLWHENELKCIDLAGNQEKIFANISYRNCSQHSTDHSISTPAKILATVTINNTNTKKFSGKNLLIFLFAIIVLSSLFVYLLNKNRKSLVRAQQRRYIMLRDNMKSNQQEHLSLNKPAIISDDSNKKSSFLKKLFNRNQPYEEFNDEYVDSSTQVFKLNRRLSDSTDNEDVIIMDRSSLNGSTSQIEIIKN